VRRRRIAAGGEGGGDADELLLAKGAVDGAAIAVGDLQDGPVVAAHDETAVPRPCRANGKPARVVEEGVGDDAGGLKVVGQLELPDSVRRRTYVRVMHWRRQGDLGELSAMEWFAARGASIAVPVGHSPDWDFIAELGDRLLRVQVKTCTFFRNERWEVSVCTRGGNQSWNRLVKRFDPSRCDYLFAVVGNGRRWCIPSAALEVGTGVALGGPKYAEFEVEPGRPLRAPATQEPASTIEAP
jgi:hypothetical protein